MCTVCSIGREDDGKFRKRAPPAASTSGENTSGTGETGYEELVELLATPVAAASMPALPSGAGSMSAEEVEDTSFSFTFAAYSLWGG